MMGDERDFGEDRREGRTLGGFGCKLQHTTTQCPLCLAQAYKLLDGQFSNGAFFFKNNIK